ncbi:TAXI family TRAP transporter solute-binding subunit [Lacibacterium aquatile]|uniref:TAXI family TRAP transporter solute-binding subunit n=1 Tax=Lacibacterium aquatile TaxID=1168082 RepID=A0ABW5DRW2_9PROT
MSAARSSTISRRKMLALVGGVAGGGALGAVGLPRAGVAQSAMPNFFRICAGPFDSAAYGVAGMLGNLLSSPPGGRPCERGGSCGVQGLIAVALAAESANEVLSMVMSGQAEAAVISAFYLTGAQAKSVRTVASLHSRDMHILVRQDAEIDSIVDLRRSRIAIGIGADIETQVPRSIIRHAKLLGAGQRADVMQIRYGLEALAEGEIDAFFAMLTPPAPLLAERAKSLPLSMISMTEQDIPPDLKSVSDLHLIPGGTYSGVGEASVLVVPRQLVVRADLSDDFVYALTGALWHPQTVKAMAGAGLPYADILPETALQAIVQPLHPGAERYYREKGLIAN